MSDSTQWYRRSMAVTPAGVHSPVRAFRAVGGSPRVIRRAAGAYLIDEDGERLIDLIGSWGAMIVGHAHPAVTEAIERVVRDGTSFGTCHRHEIQLSEEIVSRVASVERVRLVNSGTEAVMAAVRLARGFTNRSMIVKFAGAYHGHTDALLARAGSGLATADLPSSAGVPAAATGATITLPYNDLAALETLLVAHGDEIAAVLVEPIAGNMGVVPPTSEFLPGVRSLTQRCGALLIFDEVMTGFRVASGGAQALFGVDPDLTTFGKIVGGGLPAGAFGGRREIMQQLAPDGPVYQAGTMSGNPVATAAGLATLKLLDDSAYATLERRGALFEHGLRQRLVTADMTATIHRVGSMLSVFPGTAEVRDFADAMQVDTQCFGQLFHALLDRGVHLPPSAFESWFLSLAHDESVIGELLSAFDAAIASLAAAQPV